MTIKEAREAKGLTMEQTGKAADVSLSMYCLIENGHRRPSPESAKRLSAVLGIPWTAFFEDNSEDKAV